MALTERYVTTTGAGAHTGVDEANAFSWAEMITDSATSAAGTRYNIKNNGTYARTTTTETLTGGTATSPKIYRGYSVTPGDGYLGRTNGTEDLISTNMPVVTYTTGRLAMGAQTIVESLNLTSAHTASSGTLLAQASCLITRCIVNCTGTSTTTSLAISGNSANQLWILNNDISQTASSGTPTAMRALSNTKISGNRIWATRGTAIELNVSGTPVITNNLIYNSVTGINGSSAPAPWIGYNTITGCSGDAIVMANGTIPIIFGNMITDNGGWGVNFTAANIGMVAYNRLRDNASGNYNNATDWVAAMSYGDVTTDTGGPSTDYVDSSGGDFMLVATSLGVSAAFPFASSMGAFQRSQTASLAPSPLISTLVQSVANGT